MPSPQPPPAQQQQQPQRPPPQLAAVAAAANAGPGAQRLLAALQSPSDAASVALKLSNEVRSKLSPATLAQAGMAIAQTLGALGHDTDDVVKDLTSVRALAAASASTSAQQSADNDHSGHKGDTAEGQHQALESGDMDSGGGGGGGAGGGDEQAAVPQQGLAEACDVLLQMLRVARGRQPGQLPHQLQQQQRPQGQH